MSTKYLSISLCLLQFLSKISDNFQCMGSFTSLVKFSPRYFILFVEIVNGIVFLISLSASLLLVYRNATDFCIFTLYSATLFIYYFFKNVPYAPEENVYSAAIGWNVLYKSIKPIWSNASFKAGISLSTLCLDDLSIDVSGMLKFPTLIVVLSISPFLYTLCYSYVRCININNYYFFLINCPLCYYIMSIFVCCYLFWLVVCSV